MKMTCPSTALATITPPQGLHGKRQAVVDINGHKVGFWVENNDNPDIPYGHQVRVAYHPDDQYAKIIC